MVSVQEKAPVLPIQNKYAQLIEEVELKPVADIPVVLVNNDETLSTELFDLVMKNNCPVRFGVHQQKVLTFAVV